MQTEKEKETKPIAEETTLIAEETVSTKKTAKVERTDLALENTELRPERTEKVEKDKKTKRKSCRNDSKCVGANTEKGRRERYLFSSRIARENHLRT